LLSTLCVVWDSQIRHVVCYDPSPIKHYFVLNFDLFAKIEKTRWDPHEVRSPKQIMEKLYMGVRITRPITQMSNPHVIPLALLLAQGSGDLLKYVVDTMNPTTLWSTATWQKEAVFPLSLADVGYAVTDGFQTQCANIRTTPPD